MGTTTGRPLRGSSRTSARNPKTSSSTASVNTSRGGPCSTTAPCFITTTRSLYLAARLRSCSTITTVRPRSRFSRVTRSSTSTWWARSRKVVGSSRRTRSVSWASVIAIQARCRCPPDSSSRARSRRSQVSVIRKAASTTCSSSGDHWRNQRWCGCRPRPTRSRTRRPSGATGLWGSRASRRETSRVDTASMASSSSRTLPPLGLSSRARVRSKVDLPQPLGPTTVVTRPSGRSRVRSRTTGSPPYPTVTPSAPRRDEDAVVSWGELMRTSSGWCGSAARSGTAPRSPR